MIHIVDTHTLVWFLEEQDKLGPQALKILRDPQQRLIIPSDRRRPVVQFLDAFLKSEKSKASKRTKPKRC